MGQFKDYTGQQIGMWKVIKRVPDHITPKGTRLIYWLCECQCEKHTIREVCSQQLSKAEFPSCGCFRSEKTKQSHYQSHKKFNRYEIFQDYVIGYTSNTNKQFFVDLEDYDKIKEMCWREDAYGYAKAHMIEDIDKQVLLHRLVLGTDNRKIIDHINHNKLDCRKSNMRECSKSENSKNMKKSVRNKSGVSGVAWERNKWTATICVNYQKIHLGRFDDKQDAIIARLKAEKEYYGEFSPQHHLFEKYKI